VLAGISTDYYLRLEQGREDNPSDEVLAAIAHALQLDDEAVTYMRNLVRRRPVADHDEPWRRMHPAIGGLLNGWPQTAAHIYDPGLTVVAANLLAEALSPHFGAGANTMRALFLEPQMREFFRNWNVLTTWAVSLVRAFVGQSPSPALVSLVDELKAQSERFRQLWARHDVKQQTAGLMLVSHPQVGLLDLYFQQLVLPGTGHVLVVYWAEPGSRSEEQLRLLGGF